MAEVAGFLVFVVVLAFAASRLASWFDRFFDRMDRRRTDPRVLASLRQRYGVGRCV